MKSGAGVANTAASDACWTGLRTGGGGGGGATTSGRGVLMRRGGAGGAGVRGCLSTVRPCL